MANDKIEESQQQSQGVAIGTQGNQDIKMPTGAKGTHHSKEQEGDRNIPNQDRSSASNANKNESE